MDTNEYALITGASKGIGKSIALALARAGYNLLLVARSEEELIKLSAFIQAEYKVNAIYLCIDLSAEGAASRVASWSDTYTANLSILINNAGYGLWGNFESLSLPDQLNMLQLNVSFVVELSHHLLHTLKQQKQAYILNIASTAAYQAVPALAVYAATKTFILSYSRALRYELKDSAVSVSCLCPGPTETGFASRAGMDALTELAEKFNTPPDQVAAAGLKGMFNKKAEIIPGFINKLSAFGATHLPKPLTEWISARLFDH